MTQVLPEVEMGRTTVTEDMIAAYHHDGFVKVPSLLTKECAATFRAEALGLASGDDTHGDDAYRARLTQQVNIWQKNEAMKQLTMSEGIATIAEQLSGVALRLWHDHILSKEPHNGLPTEWHQDQPYWPHENSAHPISVWIALQDTPSDLGCMSFIPGSHRRTDLPTQNLGDARSLFSICPELEFEPKVTLPLRAGDATFHHGRTAHTANANALDEWRIAHVIIYMDDQTQYSGKPHVVTEKYKAEVAHIPDGAVLDQGWFPRLAAGESAR